MHRFSSKFKVQNLKEMTKEEKYTLAKWAMNHALENGAQQASVNISNSRSSSVEVREEKIDKLEQAIQSGLNIRFCR
jgi:PmbA protein